MLLWRFPHQFQRIKQWAAAGRKSCVLRAAGRSRIGWAMERLVVVVCACVVFLAGGALAADKLPNYLKTCHKDRPDFLQCAKKNAEDAIPHILKGDKKWKVPKLTPLTVPRVEVTQTQSLRILLTNCIINGLENIHIKDLNFDFKNRKFVVTVFTNWINLDTQYEIDGRILILPIQGKGPANFTFYDSTFTYSMGYDLVKKGDGKEYIDNIRPKVTYQLGKSYFHLDNLFNGNKQLGDQTNNFLNENQQDVGKELGQTVSETISAIVTNIVKNFITKVPFENIFLKG